jgi:hypothetical protein
MNANGREWVEGSLLTVSGNARWPGWTSWGIPIIRVHSRPFAVGVFPFGIQRRGETSGTTIIPRFQRYKRAWVVGAARVVITITITITIRSTPRGREMEGGC